MKKGNCLLFVVVLTSVLFLVFGCKSSTQPGSLTTAPTATHSSTGNPSSGLQDASYTWSSSKIEHDSWIESFACSANGAVFAGHGDGTVSSSIDGGKHWRASSITGKRCFVNTLLVDTKGTVYAGTGRGIYRSHDNGIRWTPANTGLADLGVICLEADFKGTVYATGKGVFRATDSGRRWKLVCSAISNDGCGPGVIAVNSHGQIFALGGNNQVFCLSASNRWVDSNLERIEGSLECMAVDPKDRLYIGIEPSAVVGDKYPQWTDEAPVMRSDDNGEHWKPLRICKDNVACYSLAVGKDGSILAGTNAGVFVSQDQGNRWVPLSIESDQLGRPAWLSKRRVIVRCSKNGHIFLLDKDARTVYFGSQSK